MGAGQELAQAATPNRDGRNGIGRVFDARHQAARHALVIAFFESKKR